MADAVSTIAGALLPLRRMTKSLSASLFNRIGSAAANAQVSDPVLQELTPVRQGSGFVAHARPAVHDAHVPALHTRFVPQLVPFVLVVLLSTQVAVPVAQEVVPSMQAFGFVVHEVPATHVEQTPPLHTWLAPQTVPFGSGASGLSTHVCAPVEHDVTPARQASGLVAHVDPAVQETQDAELEQTRFVPQLVPAAFGVASTQSWTPVEHDVVPV